MEYQLDQFKCRLDQFEITLSEIQIRQFVTFYEMMMERNKKVNLTAITKFEDVVEKHYVDSLSLAKSIDLGKKMRLLDVGTGAGFPGIPLKIVFPELEIVLMDSLNKRVTFLKDVISSLDLTGIFAVHGRAEDLAQNIEYREKFDLCVSRAVANLSTLSEYCIPFVKKGGLFVSYKSGEIEKEINDAKKAVDILGAEIEKIEKFILADTDISRTLIHIRKKRFTPKSYPRKAGTPAKNPLM